MPGTKITAVQDPNKYILGQVKKYTARRAVLEEIIKRGEPIKTTSIGRTQWDPRTCNCGVKSRTDRDHAEDCTVEPVTDSSPIVAAMREVRLNDQYLDQLMARIEKPNEDEEMRNAIAYVNQVIAERDAAIAERDRAHVQITQMADELERWYSGETVHAERIPESHRSASNGFRDHRGY